MRTFKSSALIQYLDTNGDGSGAVNAIADYSGVAEEFYIEVPVNRKLIISAFTVTMGNAAGSTVVGYQNANALANGVTFEKRAADDTVLINFTPKPITFDAQWTNLCGNYNTSKGNRESRFDLVFRDRFGMPLELNATEKLVVTLNDDFTAQTDTLHFFTVTGLNFSDV